MYETLDKFFDLPSILTGIVHRVWEPSSVRAKPRLSSVHRYWTRLGLIDQAGSLTVKGREAVEDSKDLIVYYLETVNVLMGCSYTGTGQEILGVHALEAKNKAAGSYYDRTFKGSFWTRLKDRTGLLVDLCAGHNRYAVDWVSTGKRRSAECHDVHQVQPETGVSFEHRNVLADPWPKSSHGKASVILMSETLCELSPQSRFRLAAQSKPALESKGVVVVHERHTTPAHEWITSVYFPEGSVMSQHEVAEIMVSAGYSMIDSWSTRSHHGSVWKPQ